MRNCHPANTSLTHELAHRDHDPRALQFRDPLTAHNLLDHTQPIHTGALLDSRRPTGCWRPTNGGRYRDTEPAGTHTPRRTCAVRTLTTTTTWRHHRAAHRGLLTPAFHDARHHHRCRCPWRCLSSASSFSCGSSACEWPSWLWGSRWPGSWWWS